MTMTLDTVMAKSKPKIDNLHSVVAKATTKLVENCYNRGVYIVITQGLRTITEQNDLYAQGRSQAQLNSVGLNGVKAKPNMAKVTNAMGGHSNHNFSVAIDFALLTNDGKSVSWSTVADYDKDGVADWTEVVQEAKKLGFEWGGDWKSFVDMPHFEMCFGLSTAQMRNGVQPSLKELDKILKLLNDNKEKDDEPMTAAEKKAFDELTAKVSAQAEEIASQKELINSLKKLSSQTIPKWAEEAVIALKSKGAITEGDGSSYDFFRIITALHRIGVFA